MQLTTRKLIKRKVDPICLHNTMYTPKFQSVIMAVKGLFTPKIRAKLAYGAKYSIGHQKYSLYPQSSQM